MISPHPLNDQSATRCLEVVVGDQSHFVPCSDIDRTVLPNKITPLPGAAPCISGAINVNGSLYVLVDLRQLTAGTSTRITAKSRALCMANPVAGAMYAVLVDRVLGVESVVATSGKQAATPVSPGWAQPVSFQGEARALLTSQAIYDVTRAACQSLDSSER